MIEARLPVTNKKIRTNFDCCRIRITSPPEVEVAAGGNDSQNYKVGYLSPQHSPKIQNRVPSIKLELTPKNGHEGISNKNWELHFPQNRWFC